MASFQISARSEAAPGPLKGHRRRGPVRRFLVTHLGIVSIAALFVAYLSHISLSFFILLPVSISVIVTSLQTSRLRALLRGTLIYVLLLACVSLIYYGGITVGELLTHPPEIPRIILVTTTLTWTVLLDPLRSSAVRFLDRRFNLRDREAVKAVEAFNATLREEIDLGQLRERLFKVVQETMRPRTISLWVRSEQESKRDEPDWQGWNMGRAMHVSQRLEMEEPADVAEIVVDDGDAMIAHALKHSGPIEIEPLTLDSPILRGLRMQGVCIVLPLVSQGELIGLLTLGARMDEEGYSYENRQLLSSLAVQVAPALRVAQMVQERQERVREHERIEQELRTAQFIQLSLLPESVPPLNGWKIEAYYQPAREVGGDFYDFLQFDDGRLGLIIGDVTDKGVPAALVMATTQTMLRTVAREQMSPGNVLARVNEQLYAEIPPRMFVTCFYAILDPESGRMRYANAGHELPFRCHGGEAAELWATGMPLGMMSGTQYEEKEVMLAPGDSMFFYSDGLVEAHNAGREMFGLPRLKARLEALPDEASPIDGMLSQLVEFTGAWWEQEDDITLLALKRQR